MSQTMRSLRRCLLGRSVIAAQEQTKDKGRNSRNEGDDRQQVIHQLAPPPSVV